MSPMGKNILGRENSIYKDPKAEGSRVRGRQCQLPVGTLSALFWMESPAPKKCLAQKRHLENILTHRPACLPA